MGRNTQILEEIINVLSLPPQALDQMERHFDHRLILDAGNVDTIEQAAKKLRLRITREECADVLDYIARKGMVGVTIDHVEQAINELLGEDRFIEP
jgi:hypothetical protein